MKRINNRRELRALAKDLRVSPDWHEPDQQGVDARVEGSHLDNAGFWPDREYPALVEYGGTELCVILTADGEDVAVVNLATLMSWACSSGS